MALELGNEMQESNVKIKVIGVGGGGNNAVNRMIAASIHGVEYVAINTDAPVLNKSNASVKIAIGSKITKGQGAGAKPEIGEKAAHENEKEIQEALKDVDMVFITAGMGGGTGTGAAPVVAKIAKDLGILTIGIVTTPFKFEGRKRREVAMEGIRNLQQCVDSLIVVQNDRLKAVAENITLQNAFSTADDVLRCGVQSISELVNNDGYVNLDFADVTAIMQDAGYAHMAIGTGRGENKAKIAADQAVASPLLNTDITGATGIIINIAASPNISLDETEEASALIADKVSPDARIIWGVTFDNTLDDQMNITVIATGFPPEATPEGFPEATTTEKPSVTTTTEKTEKWTESVAEPAPAPAKPESDSYAPKGDRDWLDLINMLNTNHTTDFNHNR